MRLPALQQASAALAVAGLLMAGGCSLEGSSPERPTVGSTPAPQPTEAEIQAARKAAAERAAAQQADRSAATAAAQSAGVSPPVRPPASGTTVETKASGPASPGSASAGIGGILGGLHGGRVGAAAGVIGGRGAAKPAASACASAGMAAFPWPSPPQPSVSATIPRYLLFGIGSGEAKSLAAVAARLDAAFARAGYLQPRMLGAGCNGFAVVLDLERIRSDGTRESGAAGFAPPGQEAGFDLATYLRRLFYAPPGQYRQIVFVVSDQRIAQTRPPPTEGELRMIARDGRSTLPTTYDNVDFTAEHEVLALIYEFEKGVRVGDARVVPPEGRLRATVHLKQARLY